MRRFSRHRSRKKKVGTRKIRTMKIRKQKGGFKKLKCSPKPKDEINNFTCYTDDDLYKMRDMWNARHPDSQMKTNDSKEIWNFLKNAYKDTCNKESCWIKKMVKGGKFEKELLESFSPEAPKEWKKNPNEWLSSVDILDVMNQYEKAYKCFEFLGPSPIDYDTHMMYGECVWEELCHFSLENQISKGKTKIGIIFNTDPHYKSGSHWISLFINIKKGQIFFFDSAGDKPPKNVQKFVKTVQQQGKKLKSPINFKFDMNHPVEHQYENTECGIYSLFFIVHMLEDKITGDYLKTHILKDKYMSQFRKIYFNEDL